MLFPERMLQAANALPKGCFGHICQAPANTDRPVALISLIKYLQYISSSSRITIRHHCARTLSNNRRTLSPKPRETCIRKSFALTFKLHNQTESHHMT